MLQFSDGPPIESTRYALRLLRTPTRGKLHLVVTSDNLLGCWTHFYSGRTLPCTAPDCEGCRAGASARWHGYMSVMDPATSEHLLFEVTAAAAEVFAAYRAKHQTLRGCDFIAGRTSARPNARVRIACRPADLAHLHLPASANLTAVLCHIWGIPTTECKIVHGPATEPQIEHTGTALPADRGNGRANRLPAPADTEA